MLKFFTKAKWAYLAMSAALLAIGVCVLIWPANSAVFLCYAVGAVALIFGAVELVIFFVRDIALQTVSSTFIVGFLASVFGVILLVKPNSGEVFFSVVIGVFILIDSVLKIQTSFDLRINGVKLWWVMLLIAFAGAALGIILVINPFASEAKHLLMIFMGITLIFDALHNIWTVFFVSHIVKKLKKQSEQEAPIVVVEND